MSNGIENIHRNGLGRLLSIGVQVNRTTVGRDDIKGLILNQLDLDGLQELGTRIEPGVEYTGRVPIWPLVNTRGAPLRACPRADRQ